MTGLEPSLETGVPAHAGQGIRLAADLIRFAVVFALVLLVKPQPPGESGPEGHPAGRGGGLLPDLLPEPGPLEPAKPGRAAAPERVLVAPGPDGAGGAPECMESTAVVGLFFIVWLPLRGVPAVVRALRPDSDLEDEEEEE